MKNKTTQRLEEAYGQVQLAPNSAFLATANMLVRNFDMSLRQLAALRGAPLEDKSALEKMAVELTHFHSIAQEISEELKKKATNESVYP